MGSNGQSHASLTPVWTNEVLSEAEIELKMSFIQYARSERRVQEVVRVKQKKN